MPRRVFILLLPVMLVAAWFFVWAKTAEAADIIWDSSQVRVISSFEVNGWDRLVIKPGTIIKMKADGSIVSYGNIEAIGDANNPIIFTSIKDDSVGGDTNGDGSATKPAMGDWGYFLIQGEGKKVTMDYVKINYAGGSSDKRPTSFISVSNSGEPGIKLKEINITHSSIINNLGGVSFYGDAIFKMSQSNFYNDQNCPLPLGWSPTPRCDQLSVSKGSGTKLEMPYVYWGHKDGPTTLEDYLKGVKKGSMVYFNANYIPFLIEPWPSNLIGPAMVDPVILIPGIMGSFLNLTQWKIDPILHTYDDLVEAFLQNGYELDKTLFLFPYNWRQNNVLTADELKAKIDAVKVATGKQKVDIVAHSMGGLIARTYVQSAGYQNDVDQLIFLATPHQGAPEDYLAWEGAFFLNYNRLMSGILQLEAIEHNYLDVVNYIREQVPSVGELLPVYNYLQNQSGGEWIDRIYPIQYPRNEFLENLNTAAGLNALKQRASVINIFAKTAADETLTKIKVVPDPDIYDSKWPDGYANGFILGAGDGTVPEQSANSLSGVETIELAGFNHRGLVSGSQGEVLEKLTGKRPKNQISGKWAMLKRILFIRVYSPVDFVITAPNGQKVGKDFLSGSQLNEIDGAFYSGSASEAEFAVIPEPLDGEYRVELQGTGQGEYKLSASLIDDSREINKKFTGAITTGMQREFSINYSASAENPISELEPIDTIPPEIAINAPTAGAKYLHSANLVIDYTATDDFSGLATTNLMIDSQLIATTTIDLFDYTLGTHNLTIIAIDKAGNRAEKQVSFEIIANIDSTISDIEKIHERGWLADKTYEKLLKNAFKLLKIQAKYFNQEQELTEKFIKRTQDDSKLTEEQKQKIIEKYNKKLAKLKENRTKAINKGLDLIVKLLDKAKDKGLINQRGYDIIISDINYLRINL